VIVARQRPHVRDRPSTRWLSPLLGVVVVLSLGLPGCDGNGSTLPGDLRFGQVGQVEVELYMPLDRGSGSLNQILTWGSSGAWSLREFIDYRGLIGDETFWKNQGDPSPLAAGYAAFITSVDEVDGIPGLELNIPELPQNPDPEPDPDCGPTMTRITLVIRDEPENAFRRWVRCTEGSLSNLTPTGAGPDAAASRVVSAAIGVTNGTVGPEFISAYHGSVPFGTLARGEDTSPTVPAPLYLLDDASWLDFWQSHTGGTSPPEVDFTAEMVIVAAVGVREEAGDSVEVRRILQVSDGTLTYVLERTPGDFCSPAARTHVPFHVVVAPRSLAPAPYRFADIEKELVTCGG
jgi:hypothetical protein